MSNLEQTLSIVKPDAVERNLQDEIKNFIEMVSVLKMRKFKSQKQKLKNFIKYMSQNHFMANFVIISRLVQLL